MGRLTPQELLIELALSEDGYAEKDRAEDIYSDAHGSGNFTKYAAQLDALPDFYNGNKQGYPWCDVFVDWCFFKCFGALGRQMLCQPQRSAGAGCTFSAAYFRAAGRLMDTPEPGDQIFFGDAGESVHTGIVYRVDGSFVYTVEGNTSAAGGVVPNGGQVCRKRYALGYGGIYAYGRPRWELAEGGAEEAAPAQKRLSLTVAELRRGSLGAEVRSLQRLLIPRGFDCGGFGADGDFGAGTEKSLMAFQRSRGLSADGVCGLKSWGALIGGE